MIQKLVQFTLLISAGGRQREFNFRQRSSELYNVNTPDDRGDRYYFDIVSENGVWKFGALEIPTWIKENEIVVINAFLVSEYSLEINTIV